MTTADYFSIVFFIVLVLTVGLLFSRSGRGMVSFFAAGGAVPWWMSGLSLFMSFFSAGTFVVWGSIAYQYGMVAITIQWMMAIGALVIGLYIAPAWKRNGFLTVGEYLGFRFGEKIRQFYSYLFLLLSFLTTGAFLYPVAKLVEVSTGISVELSVIFLGLVVIIYTASGGLWAVIVTDVLQFVILFAAVMIVVPLSLTAGGGISGFLDRAPSSFFTLTSGEYTPCFMFSFLLYNTIFIGGNWAYVQRYTSVRSEKDARKTAWLFSALYLFSPVLWMIPAMVYKIVQPDLLDLDNEGAFLLMCKKVLPSGFLGLMLAGMIFATASSVNTTLNMMSAVFTNDVFLRFFRQTSGWKFPMLIARISTVVFGIITIGVALMVPAAGGIVEVVLSIGALTGAPLFAPVIWTLFSKKQNGFSLIFTTLSSLAITLFFKFVAPSSLDISLTRAQEMFLGVVTPLVWLSFFEFISSGTERIPVKPAAISSQDGFRSHQANRHALLVLGSAMLISGLFIGFLGFWAASGRLWTGLASLLIIIPGFLILRYGKSMSG